MLRIVSLLLLVQGGLSESTCCEPYTWVLNSGDPLTIARSVCLPAANDTKLDVMFLFDTTGSMTSTLSTVVTNANTILTGIQGISGDAAFGVAEYKDFPVLPFGGPTDYSFALNQQITTNTALVTAAFSSLTANGGQDTPESQLPALMNLTEVTTWRAGAIRIIIWFGDNPGHTGADPGYPWPGNVATVTTAMNAHNIRVYAISVSSGAGLGIQGQTIAAATGGQYFASVQPAALVAVISQAIAAAVSTFNQVMWHVDKSTCAAEGINVTFNPTSYSGTYFRNVSHQFDFKMTVERDSCENCSLIVWATVDGVTVCNVTDPVVTTGCETCEKCHGVEDGKTWSCSGECPEDALSTAKCSPSLYGQQFVGQPWNNVKLVAHQLCDCQTCGPIPHRKKFVHVFPTPVVSGKCSLKSYSADPEAATLELSLSETLYETGLATCQSTNLQSNVSRAAVYPIETSSKVSGKTVSTTAIYSLSSLTLGHGYTFVQSGVTTTTEATAKTTEKKLVKPVTVKPHIIPIWPWYQLGWKCSKCKEDEHKCVKTLWGWKYANYPWKKLPQDVLARLCECKECHCQEVNPLTNRCVQDCPGKCIPVLNTKGTTYKPGDKIASCSCLPKTIAIGDGKE